jgi:hypothetical protein
MSKFKNQQIQSELLACVFALSSGKEAEIAIASGLAMKVINTMSENVKDNALLFYNRIKEASVEFSG